MPTTPLPPSAETELLPTGPRLPTEDDRRTTIDSIRRLNRTATEAFLAEFRTEALKDYLEHLRHARHKHVRLAGWLQRKTMRKAA
jgi:hypothetical protein